MNSKNTISITEARKRIFEIAEEVQKPNTKYTLTEKGKPKIVVMSAEEYENMVEDIEMMSDPHFAEKMKRAEEEIDRGEYVTLDELKKELGYPVGAGLVLADKGKKKYSTKNKKTK